MNKNIIALSVLSTLLLGITTAHADDAPSAELKVTGTLTVPTCTVTPPNDGVYAYEKISSTQIKATVVTALPSKTQNWSVSCDAETYLTFTTTDNQRSSRSNAANDSYFGLGSINGTGKIGYYTVIMEKAKVTNAEGTETNVPVFTTTGKTFSTAVSVYLQNNQRSGWAASNNMLKSGKTFTADLTVTPVLGSSTDMNGPITDDAELDGSLTLQFAYGI